MKRLITLAVSALLLMLGLSAVFAGSASAAPAIGLPDCKAAPAAQMPGQGTAGFLDSPPATPPPPGDPFAKHPTTTIYEQYGYAGLRWNTYDVGSLPLCLDATAGSDTMWGNMALGLGIDGVALANGIHNKIANPASYMRPLDGLIITVSGKMRDVIWTPWSAVALLAVAIGLLWKSASGDLPSVVDGAAWAVLVVILATGAMNYPARISSFFDDTVTSTMASVDAGSAGVSNAARANPATGRGSLLVDHLLYDAWLRGEFGSADTPAAKTYGPRLFKAQAYTWAEAKAAQADPAKAKDLADKKAADWVAIPEEIRAKAPGGTNIQGLAGGRLSIGLMTVLGGMATTLFSIVADVFLFSGLIMLRFLVMFAPAIGVAAMLVPAVGHRVKNIAAASVVNVLAFGVGSAIYITLIDSLLASSRIGGTNLMVLVLCWAATLIAFVLLRDLLSFNNLLGFAPKEGLSSLKKIMRKVKDRAVDSLPPLAGDAIEGVEERRRDQTRKRDRQPPVEAFSRPEQDRPTREARAPRHDEARPIPIQGKPKEEVA